jgi:hypothetical protein
VSLINETQRKTAQEPLPKPPSLKPPVSQASTEPLGSQVGYQENFVDGTGELGFEPLPEPLRGDQRSESEAPASPVPNQQELDNLSAASLTTYSNLEGTGKVSTTAPEAPVGITPPINIWKDSQLDYGIPNLYDGRLLSTTSPTLYAAPLNPGNSMGANNSFNQAASRYLLTAQEKDANARASKVNFDLSQRNAPASRNTPDAEKTWHEQAWQGLGGFTRDFFFGTPEAQQQSDKGNFNPLGLGTYGKHGAGIGGALKYALSVPIGLVNQEGFNADTRLIDAQVMLNNGINPEVNVGGSKVRWNTLSVDAKKTYIINKVNNARAWAKAPLYNAARSKDDVLTNLGNLFTGKNIGDDLNDPNPALPGVIVHKETGTRPDKVARAGRTDEQLLASGLFRRATAYAPKGYYYSRDRRAGTNAFEDPIGLAYEVANQLFSPGNTVDFVGNAIGAGVAKVGGSALRRVFGVPAKKAVTQNLTQAPVEAATSSLGKVSTITAIPSNLSPNLSPEQLANVPKLQIDPVLPGLPALRPPLGRAPALPKPSSLKAVLSPEQLLNVPKLPGELAAEVGLGTPGRTVDFSVQVVPRNHDDLIKLLSTGNESQRKLVSGYTGKSWIEWQQFAARNGISDPSDIGSIGSLPLPKASAPETFADLLRANATAPDPTNLARGFFKGSTLDDLTEQSADLAAQRSVLDSALEALEKVFDTTVDVGRRAVDDVPFKELTTDDVFRALGDGTPLRLTANAFENMPQAVIRALAENDTDAIAKLINDGDIDDQVIETFVNNINEAIRPPSAIKVITEAAPATEFLIEAPAAVYHGTALKQWTPDYNVREFGSRGELGSGTYTTIDSYEAGYYARAAVGENVSVEVKYDPIEPQVFELDTSGYKATLDANASLRKNKALVRSIVDSLPAQVREPIAALFTPRSAPTLVQVMSKLESVAAKVYDSTEGGLKQVNQALSEGLRKSGYDSVFDKKTGWFMSLNNAKFRVKTQVPVPVPKSPMEAAVARYNADTTAAAKYPDHITSDANLRDSAYKVIDQARVEVDEWMEAVQREAVTRISNEEPKPVVKVVEEAPVPEVLPEITKVAAARTKAKVAKQQPASAKATVESALNDIKIVEEAGAAPEEVLQAQVEVIAALTNAPTKVVEAAVRKVTKAPKVPKLPKQLVEPTFVALPKPPKPIDDMGVVELRRFAKKIGSDISHYSKLKPGDKDNLISFLKRDYERLKQANVSSYEQAKEVFALESAKIERELLSNPPPAPTAPATKVTKATKASANVSLETMSAKQLRDVAKAKGVDISDLGRLSPKNKAALVRRLQAEEAKAVKLQGLFRTEAGVDLEKLVEASKPELKVEEVVAEVNKTQIAEALKKVDAEISATKAPELAADFSVIDTMFAISTNKPGFVDTFAPRVQALKEAGASENDLLPLETEMLQAFNEILEGTKVSKAMQSVGEAANKEGFDLDEYLTKPANANKFSNWVQAVLSEHDGFAKAGLSAEAAYKMIKHPTLKDTMQRLLIPQADQTLDLGRGNLGKLGGETDNNFEWLINNRMKNQGSFDIEQVVQEAGKDSWFEWAGKHLMDDEGLAKSQLTDEAIVALLGQRQFPEMFQEFLMSKKAPVNPHSTIREALTDTTNNLCDF